MEPIITKAKTDTTHSRRIAFSYLQNKESVQELFGPIAEKIANRPGGYVRIIKTGNRLGDSAEMCMMELVDFNELLLGDAAAKPKTRRSRRGGSGKGKSAETSAAANVEEAKVVEETKEEKAEAKTEKAEAKAEVAEPTKEEVKEEAPKEDEDKSEKKD